MAQATHLISDPIFESPPSHYSPLQALLTPETVAVMGDIDQVGTVGHTLLSNLVNAPLKGTVFAVASATSSLTWNGDILGVKTFASLQEIPDLVDLAVIVAPLAAVPTLLDDCMAAGVQSALLVSAGWRESGAVDGDLAQQIRARVRGSQLRLLGPNALGMMTPRHGLNATLSHEMARPGNIAFVSQSGALCQAILDWSFREKVGFSAFISTGSMLDIGWGDLITYLGDDPYTHSILLHMETVGDARAFLSAAREVALQKPIIVIKGGSSEAAIRAVHSHMGGEPGSDEVFDAALRRCGVLRVTRISELFNLAEVLAKRNYELSGPRLTIITNSGGVGVLATDALVASGGQLAELTPATLTQLDQVLPEDWSHQNPIDLLGDADANRYQWAVEAAVQDANTDGILVILTPQGMVDPTDTAERLTDLVEGLQDSPLGHKPILASWMGGAEVLAGESILNHHQIPTYPYPDSAARLFNLMWQHSYSLQGLYETPMLPSAWEESRPDRQAVEEMVQRVRAAQRSELTPTEAAQVLTAYGIPVKGPGQGSGQGPGQGDAIAPSPAPYELRLASQIDPQFGPVIVFGNGGQLMTVYCDRAVALPPLNTTLARRLLEQTHIYQALQGNQGNPPIDLAALEDLLVKFSQLIVDQRWIKAIDLNPLWANPDPASAAPALLVGQARMVLHDPAMTAQDLPALAIRPYPAQYVTHWQSRDGRALTFRPIRPEDEPLIVEFHKGLSDQSVYLYFAKPLGFRHRVSHERLTRICSLDYDREMTLVADYKSPLTGEHSLLAAARLTKLHGTPQDATIGKFVLIVRDADQNKGLGTELLQRLIAVAQAEGLTLLRGTLLPENQAMQRVCQKLGFQLTPMDQNIEASLRLT